MDLNLGRQIVVEDEVDDGEAPTRSEDPKRFGKDAPCAARG